MRVNPSFKNIAFSTLIKINGRQYEFNFRKSPGEKVAYEADVTDANGERVMFLMVAEQEQWRIQGVLVPAWIEQHAAIIGEAIDKNFHTE